jgi:hypothetical protein
MLTRGHGSKEILADGLARVTGPMCTTVTISHNRADHV